MEPEATFKTMGSLQKLYNGDEKAEIDLLENIGKYGGIKKIMDLLITEYLKAYYSDPIFLKINELIKNCPTKNFEYSKAYPNIDQKKTDEEQELAPAWNDVID